MELSCSQVTEGKIMTFKVPILHKGKGYQFLRRMVLLGLNLNTHPPPHTPKANRQGIVLPWEAFKRLVHCYLFMQSLSVDKWTQV